MVSRRDFLRFSAMAASAALIRWQCPSLAAAQKAAPGEYDAAIVGGGLGGLSLAAYMARNGLKPLVLERHWVAGGYAGSFTRTVGDRTFACEISLHGTAAKSPSQQRLFQELGVLDKLDFVPHQHAWYSRYPDGDLVTPVGDLDGLEAVLAGRFPEQSQGLAAFTRFWKGLLKEMAEFDRQGMPWLKALFPTYYPKLWDIRNKTLGQVIAEHVSDTRAAAVLAQAWGYFGLPPEKLSAFYYLIPTGQYFQTGSWYLKGTSASLRDALVEVIRQGGGEVRTSCEVRQILIEKGQAAGVVLEGGEAVRSRAVAVNASTPDMAASLTPPGTFPADYLQRLGGYSTSLGSFVVWLGLDRDVSGLVPAGSVSVVPGYDPNEGYAGALAADPGRSGFAAMFYDKLAPGFSPPGCSTMSLIFLSGFAPWEPFAADYEAGNKDAYDRRKKELADRLVNLAEKRLLPGLSKMIVMREAATPLTNRRFTANPGGAIYGYDQTVDNSFMSRLPNRVPVKRLYLAGAWGNPGGGYAGAILGGKGAFKCLVEDLGLS